MPRSRRGASRRQGRAPLPPGFGSIWSCVALDLVGFGIVLPILTLYAKSSKFHASPATATALLASFSGAQLLFSPVWGRVSDRIGRKPVLVLSLVGTAVGSLITGFAPNLTFLFIGRIIDGVSGASVSVAQAAVADVAEPHERPRLMGLLGAAFGLGFVAGPAIGALAALGGPSVPFVVAGGIAGINAITALRRLPETNPHAGVRTSGPDPLRPSGTRPSRSRDLPNGPAGGAVAGLVGVSFIALFAFSVFEGTFALYGADRVGLKEGSTGAVFTGVGLLIVLVQVRGIAPTVKRFGEAGAIRMGLLLNSVGLVLLMAVHSWWVLVPSLVILTLGQGLASPTLTSAVAGRAGERKIGGLLGLQQAAGGLARTLGPLVGGLLFQHVSDTSPYAVGALLTVAAALFVATATSAAGPAAGGRRIHA